MPELLRDKLVKEVGKLRDIPDVNKDRSSASDEQVLHLVHPSM